MTQDEMIRIHADMIGGHHSRAIEVAGLINIIQRSDAVKHPSYGRYHRALISAFGGYLAEEGLDFSDAVAAGDAIERASATVHLLAALED